MIVLHIATLASALVFAGVAWQQSLEGEGSTFTLTLPVALAQRGDAGSLIRARRSAIGIAAAARTRCATRTTQCMSPTMIFA